MPWAKFGDNAATYPALMQTRGARGADERTVNEVAGWLWRCMIQSAAHLTDYRIDIGTAEMIGGPRTAALIRICTAAGLITELPDRSLRTFEAVQDEEFVHIRLREEIQWERQQRNDTRDPGLAVPVRRRDGDQCRWCQTLVQWRGKTTRRSGTLDHLVPGEAGTVATMVVACKGCNSARKDNPQWDDDHELTPPPAVPVYGRWTAEFLTENGYPTTPTVGPGHETSATAASQRVARRSGSGPDTMVAGAVSGGLLTPGEARTTIQVDAADSPAGAATALGRNSPPNSVRHSVRTSSAGSGKGRDSSGSVTARDGPDSGLGGPVAGREAARGVDGQIRRSGRRRGGRGARRPGAGGPDG